MRRSRSKIKIRSYPTEEYLGLIFAFLGDGAVPPFPRYSDLDVGGIVDALLSEEWPCNYFNRLDNLGDPVHVPFTHRESRCRIGIDVVVPVQLVAKENDVGIKLTRKLASGKSEARYILMPNMNHLRHPLKIKGSIAKQLGGRLGRSISLARPIENDRCWAWALARAPGERADAKKNFMSLLQETEQDGPSHVELAKGFFMARRGSRIRRGG